MSREKTDVPQRWVKLSGLLLVVAVLGVWLWIEATPAPRIKPAASQAIHVDKSPNAQAERKASIDEFIAKGLIRRVDLGRKGELKVSLRPGFYVMEEEMRRKTIEVLYAYHFDGTSINDTVILRDARHGNEVGTYNPYNQGLRMYK